MATRSKRLLIVAAAAAIVVALLAVRRVWFPGRAFDPAAWQADAEVGSGDRQAMADRLLAQRALNGLTRAELVGMLGEPPATDYFSDWDLVYWLGDERGFFGVDSEWLVVQLDDAGRVAEAQLVTD